MIIGRDLPIEMDSGGVLGANIYRPDTFTFSEVIGGHCLSASCLLYFLHSLA